MPRPTSSRLAQSGGSLPNFAAGGTWVRQARRVRLSRNRDASEGKVLLLQLLAASHKEPDPGRQRIRLDLAVVGLRRQTQLIGSAGFEQRPVVVGGPLDAGSGRICRIPPHRTARCDTLDGETS